VYVGFEIREKMALPACRLLARARKKFKTSTAAACQERIQIVRTSSKAGHKKQNWKTMTRSAEELSRDERIDLKVLVEYIKNDLFPKAKFVLGKEEWDVGRTIYKDYIKCCDGRIGFQTMTVDERGKYMQNIWLIALNKKLQKKALVQKRSAIYTVMQNKFTGNLKQSKGGV
jgi:hypothetical protein